MAISRIRFIGFLALICHSSFVLASPDDAKAFIRYYANSPGGSDCARGSSKTIIQNTHDTKAIMVQIEQIEQVSVESPRPPSNIEKRLSPNESIYSCSYVPCEGGMMNCPLNRSWTIRGAYF